MKPVPTTTLGNEAEQRALRHLEYHQCELIVANFRSKPGEIDLIMLDGETLVFVEVRYRSDTSRGTGADTITRTKIRRIIKTAEYFLVTNKAFRGYPCRFDVVSLDDHSIDWIKRAFTLDD